MSSQTQPGGTYGSNPAEQVSVDASAARMDYPSGSLKSPGRPPVPVFKRMQRNDQESVSAASRRLLAEASMLRLIAARVVGKGQRIAEVRQKLFEKSWELDKFAGSLQELP